MIFRRTNTFALFEQCVDDYENKTILDFGGNRGNLIATSNGKILPENYTCLDISKESLELCEQENPGVKTIYWNRYDQSYNPDGNREEPFPELKKYDIVFANSVFTHHKLQDALVYITNIMNYCDYLVFTYIDPANEEFLLRFAEKYHELEFDKDLISYTRGHNNMLWSAFDTQFLAEQLQYYEVKVGKTDWFNYMSVYK